MHCSAAGQTATRAQGSRRHRRRARYVPQATERPLTFLPAHQGEPQMYLKPRTHGHAVGHLRSMELPEIAIWVSSGSAVFTATNAIVSYRTFKRVRPKVKVALWRTGVVTYEDESRRAQYQFILRFLNNGATPVSVERIELHRFESWHPWAGSRILKGQLFQKDERPTIPALDGTTCPFYMPVGSKPEAKYVRFRVLLSNGRTAIGPLLGDKPWILDPPEPPPGTVSH